MHNVAVTGAASGYYGPDLALVHHRGFGFHADRCAPGLLEVLAPVRARNGLVLELGCGSGLLTRHLVDAGHRVLATDGSPAMLELAAEVVPDAEDLRLLVLPDDPLPSADAVVSVGHVLNYLPTERDVESALVAVAKALEPSGMLAIDLCDLQWGEVRRQAPPFAQVTGDWAIITRFSLPAPNRFVRDITTFLRDGDESWHRDDEHHENVLVDTSAVPVLLRKHGVRAAVREAFGDEDLGRGLHAVTGTKFG